MTRSRKTKTMALAIATLAGLALDATTANADPIHRNPPPTFDWIPLGTGCASAIAVGPNNVPWVLGCESTPFGLNPNPGGVPQSIYYLAQTCTNPPVGILGETKCVYGWRQDGTQTAMTIAVNANGWPFVTDSAGVIYEDVFQPGQPANLPGPHGEFRPVGNGAGNFGSFAVGVSYNLFENGPERSGSIRRRTSTEVESKRH